MEVENDGEDFIPETTTMDLENGIFQLVISLSRKYSEAMDPPVARELVATYLERIVSGLRTVPVNPVEGEQHA